MTENEILEPDFDDLDEFSFAVDKSVKDKRLDVFLADKLSRFSRTFIANLIKAGKVTVTNGKSKAGYKLRGIEEIKLYVPRLLPVNLKPFEMQLDILYEDDYLIVVNKPAGITTHPVNATTQDTLANALLAHTNKLSNYHGNPLKLGIVHRLDRDTSGVFIAAKDEFTHFKLAEQFQERLIQKEYHAVVIGSYPYDEDIIDAAIARHPKHPEMMTVSPTGKEAVTFIKVIERLEKFTYLKCMPKTGRTHQIRVHLSYKGFPVVADKLYQSNVTKNYVTPIKRHALHAKKIEFTHPITNEKLSISADLPEDFKKLLEFIKTGK